MSEAVTATRGMPPALRAGLWMGGTLLSFCVMAVAVRELTRHMGSFEILFLRSVVSLAVILAILPFSGLRTLRTRRFGLHLLRNALHFGGQYGWVYAIGFLPLATVFAIEFTMPVWTALLAMPILGERLNRGRVVMLVLGLAGISIILKPGVAPLHPAALVMLGAALAYAMSMIATKRLTRDDSVLAILFYMSVLQVPMGLIPALPEWVAPAAPDVPWIAAVGVSGMSAHYCMARAFRLADAALVAPIDFLRLPLIAAVGAVFYGEPLDISIFVGAAVIFAGTYYSIRGESHRKP